MQSLSAVVAAVRQGSAMDSVQARQRIADAVTAAETLLAAYGQELMGVRCACVMPDQAADNAVAAGAMQTHVSELDKEGDAAMNEEEKESKGDTCPAAAPAAAPAAQRAQAGGAGAAAASAGPPRTRSRTPPREGGHQQAAGSGGDGTPAPMPTQEVPTTQAATMPGDVPASIPASRPR